MIKSMNRNTLICIIALFLPPLALAQEEQALESSQSLERTVVESTEPASSPAREAVRRERERQQIVAPVVTTKKPEPETDIVREVTLFDSISAAEIRAYQRRGLEDVLRQSAGVTVVQTGQAGNQTSLFVRGQESDHAVVLLNGRRLPPGLAGLYQLEFLEVSTLESVQLHRGPVSSLYGSDALAGAIDLQSTDARHVRNDTLEAYGETGSFETARSGVRIGLREGPVGIALDGATTDTANDRANSDFSNRVLRGNVAYEIADGVHFDLLGYIQNSTAQVAGPNPSSFGPPFPADELNQNTSFLFSPRFTIERDEWDFSLFYSHTGNELIASQTGGFDNLLTQAGEEVEALFNYRPTEDVALAIGAGHYHYAFARTPLAGGAKNAFDYGFTGVFGQADLSLTDRTDLLVSYRHDEHDSFPSRGTYSVQLSHHIPDTDTTVFGRVATGYKVPSGQDYAFLDSSVDPSTLNPEESESIEIGVRQRLGDRAEITASWFNTEVDNLVDGRFNFATFSVFPTVVDTEIDGAEVELRVSPGENLEIYANYTWLDAVIVRGLYGFGAGSPGDRLPRRPRQSFSGGLVYTGDRWELGAEVRGAHQRLDSGNVPLQDYTVARAFGSVELSDHVELYGRVENVFDENYETVIGYRAPGTGAFVGCRVVLGR